MISRFFQLLRYSIDPSQPAPTDIKSSDGEALYRIAAKHALLGVAFKGIERLPESQRPDKEIIIKWFSASRKIAAMNATVNNNAAKVAEMFSKKGFRTCLLKGQGNALLYPDPHTRTPGDIDIWVDGGTKRVLALADKVAPGTQRSYHHTDFPPCGGTEVEVHYRPSFMNNPVFNSRLQRYFSDNAERQFSNTATLPDSSGNISVPTAAFNRIFQMSHIYRHLTHEGIGLRQLLDYYYVLKQGFTDEEKAQDQKTLKRCGMYKIAAAVMYVQKEVFGLDDCHLTVPPDEHNGKILLNEIMQSGNFGFHDSRLDKFRGNRLKRNIQRCVRDIRFASVYPGESLWEPVFRLWHFAWRIPRNWKNGKI